MGTNYYIVKNRPTTSSPIHIGKSSMGWRFHFQRQDLPWNDPPIVWHTWNQVKAWLDANVVKGGNYIIMNEYDEIITRNDFIELVERKQAEDNPDNFSNADDIDGYRFSNVEFS